MSPRDQEDTRTDSAMVTVKDIGRTWFVFRHHEVTDRTQIPAILTEMADVLRAHPEGRPMMLIDFGCVKKGLAVDVGISTDEPIAINGFETREIEPTQVLSGHHRGDYSTIRDTYLKMYAEIRERGLIPQTRSMEVVHQFDLDDPDATVIEIQWPLHDWTGLLADGIEEVLGPEARDHVMEGAGALTPETTREERLEWVKAALLRLDGIADEEQRYWAVSVCADCYPAWRIEELRKVYLDTGSVDDVMEVMKGDTEWYSTPYREGDIIYHTKVPYDRETWESTTDPAAKRRAYCHCALVQDRIDQVPPTYCYCGTGWVRQVWEGVLERTIRVEVLKSLPAGDDECQFLIHLPDDVVK